MGIVFHCFTKNLPAADALERLKGAGVTGETPESIKAKYDELEALGKKWGFLK